MIDVSVIIPYHRVKIIFSLLGRDLHESWHYW
jgi:hypothetical protein